LRALVSDLAPSLFGPRTPATLRYAATVNVKRALSVKRLGTSNAVEIGFTSRNPDSAATIANGIAQAYIDSQLELKRQARADAASQLRDRLSELRSRAFPVDRSGPDSLPMTADAGGQAESRFRELQNSAEAYRTLYNTFLQRNYAESVEGSSFPGARVITSAVAPAERSWPRASLVLAVAAACGLAGGIGHALLRQVTDHRLRTVADVEASAARAFVVGVPNLKKGILSGSGNSQREGLQPTYAIALTGVHDLMGKVAAKLPAVVNNHNKSKNVAVRTQGGSTSIVGVVAPTDGSGASMIAADLARLIAESGQRTLLVDANWRKPIDVKPGLNATDPRALERTRTTIQLNSGTLDILMLRAAAPLSELNASRSIVSALQALEAEYDWIVVDFHSTEQTADFELCVSIINTAIVVVEAGHTSSESLRGTLQLVPKYKVGAIIMNKIQNVAYWPARKNGGSKP
jgi:succinoglycan biosynthesis transport protein ExoP